MHKTLFQAKKTSETSAKRHHGTISFLFFSVCPSPHERRLPRDPTAPASLIAFIDFIRISRGHHRARPPPHQRAREAAAAEKKKKRTFTPRRSMQTGRPHRDTHHADARVTTAHAPSPLPWGPARPCSFPIWPLPLARLANSAVSRSPPALPLLTRKSGAAIPFCSFLVSGRRKNFRGCSRA